MKLNLTIVEHFSIQGGLLRMIIFPCPDAFDHDVGYLLCDDFMGSGIFFNSVYSDMGFRTFEVFSFCKICRDGY